MDADEEISGSNSNDEGGEPSEDTGSTATGADGDKTVEAEGKSESEATSKSDKSEAKEGEEPTKDKSADDGEKAKDEGKSGKGDDKSEAAPEEYAAFNLPEGVQADEKILGEFSTFAKDANLSQEKAQELVNLHVKTLEEAATQQQEKWDSIKEGWRGETLAIKSLQDEKGSADAAIAASRKAVEQIGGDPLKEAMDLTGFGNHPEAIKAFHKISKALAEDSFVFGSSAESKSSAAEKLYPTMHKK